MSDLVGNPEDWFSHVEAHKIILFYLKQLRSSQDSQILLPLFLNVVDII